MALAKSAAKIYEIYERKKIFFIFTYRHSSYAKCKNVGYGSDSYGYSSMFHCFANLGGFQLEFVSIGQVINHMTFYKFSALIV